MYSHGLEETFDEGFPALAVGVCFKASLLLLCCN
jgi:hypothetical protein